MPNPLEQILSQLFAGQRPMPQVGIPGGAMDINDMPLPGVMGGIQAQGAPSPSPGGNVPGNAPVRAGGQSGGFSGGLASLLMPNASKKNKTIQWLQSQGMDEGTAAFLANDRTALRQHLNGMLRGPDPMAGLKYEKAQLEIDKLRNPMTDDTREFEYGQENPEFTKWMRENKKSGADNIMVGGGKYGPIPPGYQLIETPEGARLEAIPGSEAAAKEQEAANAITAKQKLSEKYANVVVEDIDRAVKKIEASPWFTTGILGDWSKGFAGTPAHKVSRLLDTIKANAGFDRLQEMRDASPTGGALGQVSNLELGLLQSAIGSLEQSQGDEDLIYNLRRVQEIYNDTIHGTGNRPAKETLLPDGNSKPKRRIGDYVIEQVD